MAGCDKIQIRYRHVCGAKKRAPCRAEKKSTDPDPTEKFWGISLDFAVRI